MAQKLSIIGFGSQAKAWALNLRDSGWNVFIGLRPNSSSFSAAKQLGFETFDFTTRPLPCKQATILIPDNTHLEALCSLERVNQESATLFFAHGYSLWQDELAKKFSGFEFLLLAPKAIASEVRMQFETGGKLGGLYSAELSSNSIQAKEKIFALADALGIKSLHPTSIESETKADLFSEQSLLCSVLPYSALHSFNKLIEKGINEETAFFECWHEVKLIADSMVALGPEKFFSLISPNALIGGEKGAKILFDQSYLENLEKIYSDIEDKTFSKEIEEANFGELRKRAMDFWSGQALTKAHQRLAPDLYGDQQV